MISESNMDPHDFYEKMVAPYKGELELWYQKNKSTYVDIMLIFLTAWVIIFPKSELLYSVFKDLPKRPTSIRLKQEHV
jgi:hypothetical protein